MHLQPQSQLIRQQRLTVRMMNQLLLLDFWLHDLVDATVETGADSSDCIIICSTKKQQRIGTGTEAANNWRILRVTKFQSQQSTVTTSAIKGEGRKKLHDLGVAASGDRPLLRKCLPAHETIPTSYRRPTLKARAPFFEQMMRVLIKQLDVSVTRVGNWSSNASLEQDQERLRDSSG